MIGRRIKKYLQLNGISQTHVANSINIPTATLNNWLNNGAKIDVEDYAKICDVLRVEYSYFIDQPPTDKTPTDKQPA